MAPSERLVQLWPAAGIRIRAGDLELRWIDDELLVELADLVQSGVSHLGGSTALPLH